MNNYSIIHKNKGMQMQIIRQNVIYRKIIAGAIAPAIGNGQRILFTTYQTAIRMISSVLIFGFFLGGLASIWAPPRFYRYNWHSKHNISYSCTFRKELFTKSVEKTGTVSCAGLPV